MQGIGESNQLWLQEFINGSTCKVELRDVFVRAATTLFQRQVLDESEEDNLTRELRFAAEQCLSRYDILLNGQFPFSSASKSLLFEALTVSERTSFQHIGYVLNKILANRIKQDTLAEDQLMEIEKLVDEMDSYDLGEILSIFYMKLENKPKPLNFYCFLVFTLFFQKH